MVGQIQGFQLAPQQRRLWLLQRDGTRYSAVCAVLLQGELRRERLRTALQTIIERHQALRTTFQRLPGMKLPVQVVDAQGALAWQVVDLGALGTQEQEQRSAQLFDAQHAAFDLARGPLCRAVLIVLGQRRHVLLVGLPSLCADAWTLKNLVQELGPAYAAQVRGGALPAEAAQYLQFAEWQNELLKEADADAGRAYWAQRADAALAALTLPFEATPGAGCFVPAVVAQRISPEVAAQIAAVAQQSSVANVVLACWQTLLWRLTGQPSIVMGAGCDGRAYEELYGAFGLFARWVPIHGRFAPNLRFGDVLQTLTEALAEAYEWQDYFVLERAVADEAEQTPFFGFGFEYEQRAAEQSAAGVTFTVYRQASCFEPFKLKLTCVQADGALSVDFHYDTRFFSSQTVMRLSQHYLQLVAHAVADPTALVSELDILGDAERHRLLIDLNATAADYPRSACIHELFAQQAARTPDAVAIVAGAQSLAYGELNRRANQLAHFLRARGVGPDVIAGLHMQRSPELMIGLLGVLKAGGAYLPLDLEYPPERLAFMMQDSRAPMLLITTHDEGRRTKDEGRVQPVVLHPSAFAGQVVDLHADWALIAREPDTNPPASARPDNLAYVIYTSGSTGAPKGTLIAHRGLVNYLSWCTRAYALAEGTGAPVHSPLGFDLTVTSLFAPLLVGQRVLLLPEDQGIDALGIALLSAHDLSLVKLTPSHLEIINGQAQAKLIAGRTRSIILGGEALWSEHIAFWRTHAPATRLINEYGPTEAVVGCCVYEVPAALPAGAIPIGRPIANTQLYLLDARYQPVPVGVAGELFIGGDGLARGYLGRPDLTAERFVPNPFATPDDDRRPTNDESAARPGVRRPASGVRLYRTGDLARCLPDGDIEYLGRIDQQVKLRGFRIELGEIEALLLQHPAVRESVVIARADASPASGHPEQRLVAYLVLRPGESPTVSELRRFLQTRLPDYMLPSAFVVLAALPLTPNGKLDRRGLPAPDSARPDLDDAFVAPRDRIEEALAAIWATVLRLERVGIHDNFFALGGDSILSIQVIAKAHQAAIHLTPRQMFQHQTIAELAAVADTAAPALAEQGPVSGPVLLTPIQRHFFEQDLPAPQHFNQALLLTPRRPLAAMPLVQALAALLAQHDALRLRFARSDAEWQANNAPHEDQAVFTAISLAQLAAAEQGPALSAAAGELQRQLDLAEGPLLRAALFELGADRQRLLLIVHHLAMDGVSWRVLLDDLQLAYEQLAAGDALTLPPKTTSYQQWAERLASYAQGEALQAERDYWRSFGAQPISALPRDYASGANTVESARTVRVALDAEETRALLQEVPAAYHTQINDALLTALVQAVGGWSGAARLLLDLEGHGREDLFADVDLSRTVGWFTTLYPVLLDVRGAAGPGAALQAVKEQLRAVPQRGIGYGVLRYLAADAAVRALPAAEIKFNYLGQVDQVVGATDGLFGGARESSGPTRDPRGRRTHVIEVTGITAGEQLVLEWNYSATLHEQATITALAQGYLTALRELIAHCLAPEAGGYTPSDFPEMALTQAELDDLIAEL
jgi:amino acid adenylation domain-containing protein/non-ribosomal peptide synthase protein (TIGR01720 family)